ncbi:MAG: hypothetical protein ACX932_07220 [Gammaproteobacteria bacterium]
MKRILRKLSAVFIVIFANFTIISLPAQAYFFNNPCNGLTLKIVNTTNNSIAIDKLNLSHHALLKGFDDNTHLQGQQAATGILTFDHLHRGSTGDISLVVDDDSKSALLLHYEVEPYHGVCIVRDVHTANANPHYVFSSSSSQFITYTITDKS